MNKRELFDVYKGTAFIVDTAQGPTVIRHGERNEMAEQILREHSATTGAFITAFNPGSKRLTSLANQERHRRLIRYVKKNGFNYLTGRGVGDKGDWPAEESLLVIGISTYEARALGRKFGQLAIVMVESGKPAQVTECFPAAP